MAIHPSVGVRAPSPSATSAGFRDGSIVRIELPDVDIVVAVAAKRRPLANRANAGTSGSGRLTAEHLLADPMLGRLRDELDAAAPERSPERICADAIRLALAAQQPRLNDGQAAGGTEEAAVNALLKWRLKRVTAYVDDHIGEPITLTDLANVAGLSRMYFAAQFRAATGLRPHEYVLRRRVERARSLLAHTAEPIVAVALSVGFQTQAHFTTVFKRFVGETPGQWRAMSRQAD